MYDDLEYEKVAVTGWGKTDQKGENFDETKMSMLLPIVHCKNIQLFEKLFIVRRAVSWVVIWLYQDCKMEILQIEI